MSYRRRFRSVVVSLVCWELLTPFVCWFNRSQGKVRFTTCSWHTTLYVWRGSGKMISNEQKRHTLWRKKSPVSTWSRHAELIWSTQSFNCRALDSQHRGPHFNRVPTVSHRKHLWIDREQNPRVVTTAIKNRKFIRRLNIMVSVNSIYLTDLLLQTTAKPQTQKLRSSYAWTRPEYKLTLHASLTASNDIPFLTSCFIQLHSPRIFSQQSKRTYLHMSAT